MRKEKSWKELETEKTRGRKRYVERLVETKEAEKSIKEYENSTDEGGPDRHDGVRPVYRQRSEGKFP